MNTDTNADRSELDATYYDEKFATNAKFALHYTESPYFALWATVLDRLRRQPGRSVLEIGCGTGQLANLLRDMQSIDSYLGVDFSSTAVDKACKINPHWRFRCADVFEDDSLESEPYDVVISTEFLEHVNNDLEVVRRIRPDTMVIASVPNFPHPEHVRHFDNAQAVYDRYIRFFKELYVVPLPAHKQGLMHFIFQGIRKKD